MRPEIPLERRAGVFLAQLLAGLDRELDPICPRVLAGDDPEAVHDLRVAIRKIRTILKVAREVFGRRLTEHVRAAFTVIHRSTGALRDAEVLRETLEGLGVRGPLLAAFLARKATRERQLRRATVALVADGAVDHARRLLAALLAFPPRHSREREVGELARKVVVGARTRMEKQRDADTGDVHALHDLRIAYKELRYGCELFSPVIASDLSAMAEPAAKFQKRLGEIHDADMALATVGRTRTLDLALKGALLRGLGALRRKRVTRYVAERSPQRPVVRRSAGKGSGRSRPGA